MSLADLRTWSRVLRIYSLSQFRTPEASLHDHAEAALQGQQEVPRLEREVAAAATRP